jgi:hypothetical protein
MNRITTASILSLVLCAATACGEKPCESIPTTDAVKRLDVLLDGGKLCEDDSGVAWIDYPGKAVPDVRSTYVKHLEGKGWKAETAQESDKLPIVSFSKGSDTVMVTIGKSSERRVTFVMVKYCPPAGVCSP